MTDEKNDKESSEKSGWMSEEARPVGVDHKRRGRGSSGASRSWNDLIESTDEELIETSNPNIVIDRMFVNALRERGRNELDSDYVYSRVHLRDLGGCVRQIYYKMMQYPDERHEQDYDWRDVFMMGHKVESGVIEFVQLAGMDRGSYRIRTTEYPVSGEVDRVIDYDDNIVCLEVKSADEWSYRRQVDELVQGKIKDAYYYQMQAYLMFQPKFAWAQMVILNRNTGMNQRLPTYVSARVYPDEEVHQKIRDKLDILMKAIEEKKAPPNPGYKSTFSEDLWVNGDWQCRYCGYSTQCWLKEGDQTPR